MTDTNGCEPVCADPTAGRRDASVHGPTCRREACDRGHASVSLGERRGEPGRSATKRRHINHEALPTRHPRERGDPATLGNPQRSADTSTTKPSPTRHPRERGDPATLGNPQRSADTSTTKPSPTRHPRERGDPATLGNPQRSADTSATKPLPKPSSPRRRGSRDFSVLRPGPTATKPPTRPARPRGHVTRGRFENAGQRGVERPCGRTRTLRAQALHEASPARTDRPGARRGANRRPASLPPATNKKLSPRLGCGRRAGLRQSGVSY